MAKQENQPDRLEEIVKSFLEAQQNENTTKAYANDLRGFFKVIGHVPLDQITPADIVTFRQKISKQNQPSTVARKLVVIRRFFAFCVDKRLVELNPTAGIKLPRVSQESRTNGLTKEQAEQMLHQPDQTTRIGKRDYAILSLLLYNGLRSSEVCAIRWGNFGEERGHFILRIFAKGGKALLTKIKKKVMKAIEAYRAASHRKWDKETPVFVGIQKAGRRESSAPLSSVAIRLIVKKYARLAGIEKQISPHSLRHTAITLSLDGGATIRQAQYLACHSDPKSTMRYDRHRHNLDDHATDYINLNA